MVRGNGAKINLNFASLWPLFYCWDSTQSRCCKMMTLYISCLTWAILHWCSNSTKLFIAWRGRLFMGHKQLGKPAGTGDLWVWVTLWVLLCGCGGYKYGVRFADPWLHCIHHGLPVGLSHLFLCLYSTHISPSCTVSHTHLLYAPQRKAVPSCLPSLSYFFKQWPKKQSECSIHWFLWSWVCLTWGSNQKKQLWPKFTTRS